MRVGVIGATGYAGSEVLRLCASHPDLEVVLATGETNAGKRVGEHVPALAAAYPSTVFADTNTVVTSDVDVVFVALPHGQSQKLVPQLMARNVSVVDLGADFRLKDVNDYRTGTATSIARPNCCRVRSTDWWNATAKSCSTRR